MVSYLVGRIKKFPKIYRFLCKYVSVYDRIRFRITDIKVILGLLPKFEENVRIHDPYETLEYIVSILDNNIVGGYFRFGDGDINLLENKNDLLQPKNKKLSSEMREAFLLAGDGIVKGLPLHSKKFGFSQGMKPGLHMSSDDRATNILHRTYKYFIGERIYSSVALPYVAAFDSPYTVNFLKTLRLHNPILVGNENIPPQVINALFGSKCLHIKTPSQKSYDEIDRIEEELIKQVDNKSFHVVIVSMGCSGRILQKRIIQRGQNVFLFDFGSLMDIFCGWNTRGRMDLVDLPENYRDKILHDVSS